MFQKHSMMSLKKKSKSLGHLTALNSHPCSPDPQPKVKKNSGYGMGPHDQNGSAGGRSRFESVQPTAAKYMKRFLSPVSHEREHIRTTPYISSPMSVVKNGKMDKQLQTTKKTTPKKLKGVMRSKGGGGGGGTMPNPVAMGRALIQRNFTPQKNNSFAGRPGEGISDIFGGKDNGLVPSKHRVFIMDTQVKYTIGVQMQERNLFLFNDLLLIAKERSSSHFKLKDQVPLSDVWLSECISDVSEVTLDTATSFVIGWPINNAVLTFSSESLKCLWWTKLKELTGVERGHSPAGASINVTYFDTNTNFEHLKSIYVAIEDSSRDCIKKALDSLPINNNSLSVDGVEPEVSSLDPAQFQLWVKTKLDESPYPLIGHEIPLVIKLHWMRQTFNNKNQKTYDEYRQGCRCSFILRKVGQVSNFSEVGSQKKKLKKVKSSIKLQNVFRRVSQGAKSSGDSVDGLEKAEEKKLGQLFGRSLAELCINEEEEVNLPHPVQCMLRQLFEKGPSTVGIFRRGPNVRAMRDLREKLDLGHDVHWDEISVFVTAALLKDFLRSLPDCVLQCDNYTVWTEAYSNNNINNIKSNLEKLPEVNRYLLHHILYILDRTAQNNQENMMTCSNLSICVGPSLLWTQDPAYMLEQAYSKEVSGLVQMLIENFSTLFGSDPALLRGEAMDTSSILANKQTNGNKQHLQNNKQNKGGLYDHSSLDSLLDPPYPEDDLARQSAAEPGVSLTNLSHDSGLTTSDSQLYAFEEQENNSFSSRRFREDENNSFSSDDFTIETITSNQNTVHAIVNKKYLSRYAASHLGPEHVDQEDQAQSPARRKLNQRSQKHRDRMHRRIHRSSEYSNSFSIKTTSAQDNSEQGAYNYEVNLSYPLRRTASEESVQRSNNSYNIVQVNNNNNRRKRPVVHRKGRAPNPPKGSKTSPNIIRSNSVNQVRDWEQSSDWYRSKSTTRLHHSEESDESCSTLSDEDSTPHVSRSNSYGRSEENSFNDTTYDIYLHDERITADSSGHHNRSLHDTSGLDNRVLHDPSGHDNRVLYDTREDRVPHDTSGHDNRILHDTTNLDAAFSKNAARGSKQHKDFDSFSCETPPGYEESIYRQRLLKLQGRPVSYISPVRSSPNPRSREVASSPSPRAVTVPGEVIEKQVELSAKAKALFEESLRQYNEEVVVVPPPLPPKTDRPPLPPKQRSRRSTEHESSDDQTYVNSAELRHQQRVRTRLSINSPVHSAHKPLTPVHGVHKPATPVHVQKLAAEDSAEFVYGSYFSARGGTTKVSVPAGVEPEYTPPLLPPKEARTTPDRSDKKRSVTSTKIVSTTAGPKPVMKSMETQTDESDFVIMFPDEHLQEDESFNHTDSEYSPESNRSLSPDYPEYTASPYYHQPQDPKAEFYNTLFERPVSAQSVGGLRHAGRRKLEPVQSVPPMTAAGARHPDPVIAGEINWSVSQLRTLFNQGLAAQAGAPYDTQDNFRRQTIIDNSGRQLMDNRQVVMDTRGLDSRGMDRRMDYHYYGQQPVDQESDQESYV